MRTRATGYSPNGLRELGSPKRLRSQPPPPVRSSRTTKKASDSSKEESSKSRNGNSNGNASDTKEENTHANGHASNHRPNSLNEVVNNELENNSPDTHQDNSYTKKLLPDQNLDSNHPHHNKNTDGKKRDGLPKKPQSSRNLNKKLSRQASIHTQDIDIVHIKTGCRSSKILPRSQPVVSVLGKRSRNISSGSITAHINDTEFANQKRPRISEKNSNRLESYAAKSSALVPYIHSERNSGPCQNNASHPKTPQQLQNGSLREDLACNSKPTQLRSIEASQDLKISSNSAKNGHAPYNIDSNPKNLSPSPYADRTNNIETQLRQGMQNIMSRMNKYQYQPLPKNSHDTVNFRIVTNREHRVETAENDHDIKSAISNIKSQGFETALSSQSRVETKIKKPAQNYDSNSDDEINSSSKQSEREKDVSERKQTRKKMINQKDRRIEVEKLFRSTVPDASYQNILRAVAEWAVHNHSALPTREEIFTYVESSKAPDPTELFTAADRPFLRNSSSRMRKDCAKSNRSSNLVKRGLSRNKEIKRTRNPDSSVEIFAPEKDLITQHDPVSHSIKAQRFKQSTPGNLEICAAHNPENTSTLTTQTEETPVHQSWGLLNTLKTIVSNPFKAFGFGFGLKDNNEAVKEIAKDIDFVFKPPATSKPGGRLIKFDRLASKYGGLPETPARATNISRQNRQQSDYSCRHKTPKNRPIVRRTITEKRRADLHREQDLKKWQRREKDSHDDKELHHKIPKQDMDEMPDFKVHDIGSQPSQTFIRCSPPHGLEEWPPNLDSNRPVVELQQATQELPRGPNGEDVATMLCRGWLISKHRDSFIREVGKSKVNLHSISKKEFDYSAPPYVSKQRNSEVKMYDIPGNAEIMTNIDSKSDYRSSRENQPGRSYGFQYDDDSSSDEEEIDGEKISDISATNDSYFKAANPFSSGMDTSKRTIFKPKFEIKYSTNQGPNSNETSNLIKSPVKRFPQSITPSYTPRMPSTLRNVAALSYSSNKITNSIQPSTTEAIIAQKPSDTNSLTLVHENSSLSQSAEIGRDWTFTFRVDPKMAHFNPNIIAAVEALPKVSFPSVQLPSCLG